MSIRTLADRMKRQNELLNSFTKTLTEKLEYLTSGEVSPEQYRLKVTSAAEKIEAVTPTESEFSGIRNSREKYDEDVIKVLREISANTNVSSNSGGSLASGFRGGLRFFMGSSRSPAGISSSNIIGETAAGRPAGNPSSNSIGENGASPNVSPGDLSEERRERKEFDEEMLTTLKSIAENIKPKLDSDGGSGPSNRSGKGFGNGKIAGALAGGLGFGMKLFSGLAGLGFGIGGFFTGLALGDKAQALINTDMEATKRNMIALGEAFAMTPTKGLIAMGVAAAIGSKFGSVKGAMGMTLFGLGLSGFFTGLALGDKGLSLLNIDGAGLATIMGSLGEGLNAFSGKSLIALGGLFVLSKLLGPSSAILLPALGVGLAGFFTALAAIGDGAAALGIDGSGLVPMLTNLAEGLSPLSELNGGNLLAVGGGLISIGAGLAAVYGVDWIKGIGNWVGSFFGKDNEDDIFTKTARSLSKLNDIDVDYSKLDGLDALSSSFGRLLGSLQKLEQTDMGDIKKRLVSLGETVAFAIPMFDKMSSGGEFTHGGFKFLGAEVGETTLDFGKGLDGLPKSTFEKINLMSQMTSTHSSDVGVVGSESSLVSDITPSSKSINSSTSSNNMSTLIRENNETKNNAPVVIMDNSQNSTVSGGGGGSTSIVTGNLSPFDAYDPYLVTRR